MVVVTKLTLTVLILTLFLPGLFGETVVIGFPDSPGFSEKKNPGGSLNTRIAQEAFRAVGAEVQFEFLPYPRLLRALENAELACGAGHAAPEKAALYISHPVYWFRVVFLYRRAEFPQGVRFRSLADLKGRPVMVVAGSPMARLLTEAGARVEQSTSEPSCFNMLLAERGQFVLSIDVIYQAILRSLDQDPRDFGVIENSRTTEDFLFPKAYPGNEQRAADFARGLGLIRKNGVLRKLLEEHWDGPLPDWVLPQ